MALTFRFCVQPYKTTRHLIRSYFVLSQNVQINPVNVINKLNRQLNPQLICQRHYSERILRDDVHQNDIQTVKEILDSVTSETDKTTHCKWKPISPKLLEESENRIFARLRLPYKRRFVDIGQLVDTSENKIWTLSMNENSKSIPILLLHGFGAGIGFWALNLESFAQTRPVYAIDLLGFGRSSRPKFSKNPDEAENQFVDSIEEWRKRLGLKSFVLLGHSFGAYLATAYSLKFPKSVAHLILADPWGFDEQPPEVFKNLPVWVKAIGFLYKSLNPLWIVRAAGPMGKNLVERARPGLFKKFSQLNNQDGEDIKFAEYIYQCNAQKPTGESAFHTMSLDYGWAKSPMIRRIPNLHQDVDVTAIYGSHSWIRGIPSSVFVQLRNNPTSYTNIQVIHGAGHHVYSDGKDEFNRIVLETSLLADKRFL